MTGLFSLTPILGLICLALVLAKLFMLGSVGPETMQHMRCAVAVLTLFTSALFLGREITGFGESNLLPMFCWLFVGGLNVWELYQHRGL